MATVAINNLGTGTGFIYETLQDNTITCVRANTPEGVRDMLQKGAANAPIAANRSAVATITITGVAATGAFTAVTINGVNQIAGNVNVLTSNTSTEAARLAAAINNFTPATGLDYVAEVNANVITLIEPEKGGGISNGWTPTVSASSGTITSNTTDFKDGAPAATVYDVQFGRFYYLNSNIDALADDLTGSIDITKYITVRGTEVGNPTLSLTIASDGLNSVNRYANTTQIKLTNEAAAASDYLVYINSVGFVDGDLLILCAATDSQLTTIVSQPNASTVSSNPNANIYLNNNDSFTTTGILGTNIVLKYSFADSTGGTFTEIARSTKSGCINVLSKTDLDTRIAANGLSTGCKYLVSTGTPADAGLIISAANSNTLEEKGEAIFYNPDFQNVGDYSGVTGYLGNIGVWYNSIAVPAANYVTIWGDLHYLSLTGVAGTTPDTDTTNWQVLGKALTNGYILACDSVTYDYPNNIFPLRIDINNNKVGGSKNYRATNGNIDPISVFQWGNNQVYGNTSIDALCNLSGNAGTFAKNTVKAGVSISILNNRGEISSNAFDGNAFSSNTISSDSLITNCVFGANSFVSDNVLSNNGRLNGISVVNATFSQNTIDGTQISETEIFGGSWTQNAFNSAFTIAGINSFESTVRSNTFNSGCYFQYIVFNYYSFISNVVNKNIVLEFLSFEGTYLASNKAQGVTFAANLRSRVINSAYSNFPATVTPNGGVIPYTLTNRYVGEMALTSLSSTEAIYSVTNPPTSQPFVFRPESGLTATFVTTPAPGSAGLFVGDAAAYVINGTNNDFIEFQNIGGVLYVVNKRISI